VFDETLYAERVLRADANGYIMKQEGTDSLVQAIRKILDGGIYLSAKMETKMLQKFTGFHNAAHGSMVDSLSDRELEVFQRVGQGFANRQIADSLQLSVKTIETHRENLKKKLKLDNSIELIQSATKWIEGNGIFCA